MKLPTVDPVIINEKPYSLAQMVAHVTTKDRRYNATAEAARQGKRTREAVAAGGELLPEDLQMLAEVLERPTCGWGEFPVTHRVQRGDGSVVEVPRAVHFPTHLFLPLIDVVQNAAASVS